MAGNTAELLTETDDPNDLPGAPGMRDGGSVPAAQPQRRETVQDIEYEMVDVADDGTPLDDEPQRTGREAGLTEDEAGTGTYVDRQRRQRDLQTVISREDVLGMTPADRDAAWKRMDRDTRHRNRALRRAITRDKREGTVAENQELRSHVAQLAARVEELSGIAPRVQALDAARHQDAVRNVDQQLNQANANLAAANRRMSEAMTAGDNEALTAALQMRDAAFVDQLRWTGAKNTLARAPVAGADRGNQQQDRGQDPGNVQQREQPQQQRQPQPVMLTTRGQDMRDDFLDENSWIDLQGQDRDTRTALEIDASLVSEGYNPNTPEYYEELEDRLREALPQHFRPAGRQNGNERGNGRRPAAAQPIRRGPAQAAPADRGPPAQTQRVYISEGRRDELVRLGVLDSDRKSVIDRPKLNRLLRQFSDYDRANAPTR